MHASSLICFVCLCVRACLCTPIMYLNVCVHISTFLGLVSSFVYVYVCVSLHSYMLLLFCVACIIMPSNCWPYIIAIVTSYLFSLDVAGRKKVSTTGLDTEFDFVKRSTDAYLDNEPFTSTSVDGWENQAGDSVKMVNAIDSKRHSFLASIIDDPGQAGDAESYKKALEPQLQRANNVGGCTDNPTVMIKARNLIREDKNYATRVLVPCSWHATDLCAPVNVKSFETAIKESKKIVMFFKYRHRPKGVLRLKREKVNKDRRAMNSEGKGIRVIPTLKVSRMNCKYCGLPVTLYYLLRIYLYLARWHFFNYRCPEQHGSYQMCSCSTQWSRTMMLDFLLKQSMMFV